jgi:KaiC/GvpD/RAD55 family RecA-like ATPase
MLRVKKSSKIDIIPPDFVCDYPLTDHLKEYPQFSHLNFTNTTAILGRPGSGKTSMLISMLSQKGKDRIYNKVFDFVYVIMPTQSRNSLKKNIFEKHEPSRLFDELTLENLQNIFNAIKENSLNKKKSLVIYDDCTASLKNNDIQLLLKEMSFNRRHLKLVQMFLIQSWISVPLFVRKLFSNLVIFKPNKIEWEKVVEETIEQEKDVALALLNLYENAHDYLFINVPSQKLYYNQDEVLIEEEDK